MSVLSWRVAVQEVAEVESWPVQELGRVGKAFVSQTAFLPVSRSYPERLPERPPLMRIWSCWEAAATAEQVKCSQGRSW